jgi:hypothetical protein
MVTVIIVAVVFALLLIGVLSSFQTPTMEFLLVPALFLGCIIGVLIAFMIGSRVQYRPTTTTEPIVSIYTNSGGSEIYLRAISGSNLLYRVMDDGGVPREQTIAADNVQKVVIENVSPYIETTKFLFKETWYMWFAFSTKSEITVFHLPQEGIEMDINSFLK